MKILIVDDEIPIREWISYTINRLNISCEIVGIAANGAEALKIMDNQVPDLIFTDIKMPVMDGIELLRIIKKSEINCYVVILTSHDDFEYARQALKLNADEYILKTEINDKAIGEIIGRCREKNNLLNHAESLETILRKETFINEIVSNNITDAMTVRNYLDNADIRLENGYISIVAVDVRGYSFNNKLRELMRFQEGELIKSGVCFIYNNDILLIVLSLANTPSQLKQTEAVRNFVARAGGVFDKNIGVSPLYPDLSYLGRAVKDGIAGLKLRFYNSKRTVAYINTSSELQKQKKEIEEYRDKILSLIEIKKLEESLYEFEGLIEIISRYEFKDIVYVKRLFLQIVSQYAMKYGPRESKKVIYIIQDTETDFNSMENYRELVSSAESIIKDIIYNQNVNNQNYSNYVKEAISYTRENYAKIEKISEVADHLNINTEYFCRLFKSEVGVTFVTYLTNMRMTRAMELLKNSNMKVYEVANEVGYNNLSYFSRLFKKAYNKNPFKFRNEG